MNALPGVLVTGFVAFKLAESKVQVSGIDYPPEPGFPEIMREFFVLLEKPLVLGQTGQFKAVIKGTDRRQPNISYCSPKEKLATLAAIENSFGLFRASVSGVVCRHDWRTGPPPEKIAPRLPLFRAKS